MKIDRLFGILIYLLNKETASARELSERFEVSLRTIQRDMDSLAAAGIPLYTQQGSQGGYGIIESYKLDSQIMSEDEYAYITESLKSLLSAWGNKKVEGILEKVRAISPNKGEERKEPKINLEVLREAAVVHGYLDLIQDSIEKRDVLEIEYTDASHKKSLRKIEPLFLKFNWYAWYLFAYCREKEGYRIFRVSRMREVKKVEGEFVKEHRNPETLMRDFEGKSNVEWVNLKLLCKEEVRVSIEDYFAKGRISETGDDSFVMEISLPQNEQVWLGILLSYGDKVKVLEPESVKKKIVGKIEELKKLYKN